ncbi:hypothetical protein [Spirosoma fluminis]
MSCKEICKNVKYDDHLMSELLPPTYQSWLDFYNDVPKEPRYANAEYIYWYHAAEGVNVVTMGLLAGHEQRKYSLSYIKGRVIEELGGGLNQPTLSAYELILMRDAIPCYYESVGGAMPSQAQELRIKLGKLAKIERRRERHEVDRDHRCNS